jgi:hypothetical protein
MKARIYESSASFSIPISYSEKLRYPRQLLISRGSSQAIVIHRFRLSSLYLTSAFTGGLLKILLWFDCQSSTTPLPHVFAHIRFEESFHFSSTYVKVRTLRERTENTRNKDLMQTSDGPPGVRQTSSLDISLLFAHVLSTAESWAWAWRQMWFESTDFSPVHTSCLPARRHLYLSKYLDCDYGSEWKESEVRGYRETRALPRR